MSTCTHTTISTARNSQATLSLHGTGNSVLVQTGAIDNTSSPNPPKMRTKVQLLPNYAKLDKALRAVGYSFETAVADLLDNSIDAKAQNIRIRFVVDSEKYLSLAILDDGTGMDAARLRTAMTYGADEDMEIERLGKFGLGLKLASLSQAKSLLVITTDNGRDIHGMAWAEEGVSKGFECEILDKEECKLVAFNSFPRFPFKKTWTLVLLEKLWRVGEGLGNPNQKAQELLESLKKHLGLVFHRYMRDHGSNLEIHIDTMEFDSKKTGIPQIVEALDPFGYSSAGAEGFPAEILMEGEAGNLFKITAHVWPPNSSSPNYRLHGGANNRQGFYFYRKNRLIQGGGWNNLREIDSHLSLARVEIDISPRVDFAFGLDVKKSQIILPPKYLDAIEKGKTNKGVTFREYLKIADQTVRRRQLRQNEMPVVPGNGVPASISGIFWDVFKKAKISRSREISFVWTDFVTDDVFDIAQSEETVYLNRKYRSQLLRGERGSGADLPLLKTLLFFCFDDLLQMEKCSSKQRGRLDLINAALREAIKLEVR
jgi:hypothetical protein